MKNKLFSVLVVSTTLMFLNSSVFAMTCTDLTKSLAKGSENSEVTKLQQFLFDGGYLTIKPNGYFGNATLLAVKKFQLANGLSQVGSVGSGTKGKIKEISCGNKVSTSTVSKIKSTTSLKSEIDEYGTDLYSLKQGVTILDKKNNQSSKKITYTRNKDDIERVVVILHSDGGKETISTTIDLNSRDLLLSVIKKGEVELLASCKKPLSEDCVNGKTVLSFLKTSCLNLKKNEEIGNCITAAFLSPASNSLQQQEDLLASSTKSNIDSHGTDLAKLPEGETIKVYKEGPTAEVSHSVQTTVTYVRTGKSIKIKQIIVIEGQSGQSEYTNTVELQ